MSVQKFVSKDGTQIACFKSGSGRPLVLVHGTAADHTRWAPILSALEKEFTVYACDRRGRGQSGDAPEYAIEREFDDVAAVIDHIGGPVDVLGHSYGAICSLESAARARNLRRLVLYEPPIPAGVAIYRPGVIDRLQALLEAGDHDGVVSTFMTEVPRVPPDQLTLMKSLPAWQSRVSAAHTIVRELHAGERYSFDASRVRGVQVPTLLLLGGASPPFFKAALDRIQEALPQSRMIVLPGQTHVAIDTTPDLFASEVLTFLR
jgi:pimeloyl-ACP methyl ester carboxylesterase